MTRKVIGIFAFASILGGGLAGAGVLYAQQSGGMGSMMNMMDHCPMMGAMRESPQAVLKQREALGLTTAQVQRLEALNERAEQAREPMREGMRTAHREIQRATNGDRFDEAAVRDAFDRMGDLHTEMAVTMLRSRHEVRQVLTREQRSQLQEMGGGMGAMGSMDMMQMMDMMRSCPMMEGGMMMEGWGTR